jgi:hypothetical protein
LTELSYYFYCRKAMGREFYFPAQTLIVVKLFKPKSTPNFLAIKR